MWWDAIVPGAGVRVRTMTARSVLTVLDFALDDDHGLPEGPDVAKPVPQVTDHLDAARAAHDRGTITG
ncbi:hypothetical protein HEK616_22180 [Streptomyces nigrescens]|uniref:Uncharacterized protein n=1 Tax=Streptomyces nigrescens TaxID=1920 RepID=A0ABM7ZQR2_STRNI|nr:hypothetical protein HEK616_22180 [Streptomyces nigrescens]